MADHRTGTVEVVLATVLFSLNPVLFSLVALPPLEILWLVNVCAVVSIAAVIVFQRRTAEVAGAVRANGGALALLAVVFSANNLLFIDAIKLTTIARSVLTHYLAPVFVFVIGVRALGEHIGRRGVMALTLSLAGAAILVAPALAQGGGRDALGMACGVGSAVLFAAEIVVKKRLVADLPAVPVVLIYIAGSVVLLLPFVTWGTAGHAGVRDLVIVALSGIVVSGLGVSLFTSGLTHIRAQQASVISYIEPLGAILWGGLVLGQMLAFDTVLGAVLILGGTALASRPGPRG